MKSYLNKLATDFEVGQHKYLATEPAAEAIKKIQGKLMPGARCAWCFTDDIEYWKKWGQGEEKDPNQWNWSWCITRSIQSLNWLQTYLDAIKLDCNLAFDEPFVITFERSVVGYKKREGFKGKTILETINKTILSLNPEALKDGEV